MRQWLVVVSSHEMTWLQLAEEAFTFVAGGEGAVMRGRPRHWR